jgi:hypothetical protein
MSSAAAGSWTTRYAARYARGTRAGTAPRAPRSTPPAPRGPAAAPRASIPAPPARAAPAAVPPTRTRLATRRHGYRRASHAIHRMDTRSRAARSIVKNRRGGLTLNVAPRALGGSRCHPRSPLAMTRPSAPRRRLCSSRSRRFARRCAGCSIACRTRWRSCCTRAGGRSPSPIRGCRSPGWSRRPRAAATTPAGSRRRTSMCCHRPRSSGARRRWRARERRCFCRRSTSTRTSSSG